MVANYLTSTVFMIIILLILFVKICNDMKQEKMKRMYQVLDITVVLYVLLDAGFAVGFLEGRNQEPWFQIVIFLFFLVYVITPFIWQLFVSSYINVPHGRWFQIVEKLPLIILLVMVVMSPDNGYVWYITDTGDYVRGRGFELFTAINLFYYLEAFINGIYILYHKMYEKEPYLLQSLLLSTIPLAAILANTYLIPLRMTYPFQSFCLVLGTLFAYLFMADRQKSMEEERYNESLKEALELEKKASRQAVEAGRVKTIFLANMSHDIRTPINAILGFTDMIDRNPGDKAQVVNAVGKIKNSGQVLLNLINDVLDLTRIENGKLELEESDVDLTALVKDMETLFLPSVKQKGIALTIWQEVADPYVHCDEGKLQRILVNIINNAVKFTPAGGKIIFFATEVPGNDGTAEYGFRIQDTGIGISKEFQEHIFEAFEQERSSSVGGAAGAGLGLAIVKKLTDLMDGTVSIESEPGEGTAVQLRFHFRQTGKEEIQKKREAENTEDDLSGLHVLLVEDNELNMEIAAAMLKEKGASVTWASDGQQAVDRFRESPAGTYDIILMDVMMPVMNGLMATKQIRAMERPDAASIPIFAMTANAFTEDIEKSREAGVNEHLSKPLDYGKLARMIYGYVKKK
ncbi:MAG: ATP-binding protein [Anaerosacchariphilus sp.]